MKPAPPVTPECARLHVKELLHLGSREAADQAITRLARSGELSRISRGVYMLPSKGRFGVKAPALTTLLKALSSATARFSLFTARPRPMPWD